MDGQKEFLEFRESLQVCERHVCCDEAEEWLYPPRREGMLERGRGRAFFRPIETWYIDQGRGGPIIPVRVCPWCGVELEGKI